MLVEYSSKLDHKEFESKDENHYEILLSHHSNDIENRFELIQISQANNEETSAKVSWSDNPVIKRSGWMIQTRRS